MLRSGPTTDQRQAASMKQKNDTKTDFMICTKGFCRRVKHNVSYTAVAAACTIPDCVYSDDHE